MKKIGIVTTVVLFILILAFAGCQFFPEYATGNIHRPQTPSTGGETGGGTGNGGGGTSGAEPTGLAIPLTLEAIEAGSITLTNPWSTLKYKKNGGSFESVTASGTFNITVAAGDKIALYANGSENNTNIFTINCDSDCYIYGNIMSLIAAENCSTATVISTSSAFCGMFYGNTHIRNHSEKPLNLPATTLSVECYAQMFYGCSGLTAAPALPATTLAERCYMEMFYGCSGLTVSPSLPATTLAECCYKGMFGACTGLTTAPSLPASTLARNCYESMFEGCRSLTRAPDLLAAVLVDGCYSSMFYGCSQLNAVKCLARDINATNCCYNWLYGVSSSGIFTKANETAWPRGDSGIPNDWDVEGVEPEYNVIISGMEHGSVTANLLTATAGTEVTLTITPDNGYQLSSISVTGVTLSGSGNTRTFTMPENNVTVSATFTARSYSITAGSFSNGSVSFPETADCDSTVTLTITADTGYVLSSITVTKAGGGAVTLSGAGSNMYTFTMPAENVSISVTFGQVGYIISVGSFTGGSVTSSSTNNVHYGDSVTLTIQPNTGYQLSSITVTKAGGGTVDLSGSGNTRTFTMPAKNVTVNATFTQINYTVSVGSFTGGSVTSSSTNNVHYGDTITLTINPNTGYTLSSITVTGVQSSGNVPLSGSGNTSGSTRTFTMPAENVTVNATFTQINYNVSNSTFTGGTVSIEASGSSSTTVRPAHYGDTVTLTISPDDGCELESISTSSTSPLVVFSGTSDTRTFTMPASDVTITAVFKAQTRADTTTLNLGDIILNDGTVVAASNINKMSDTQKGKVAAVIFDAASRKGVAFDTWQKKWCSDEEGTSLYTDNSYSTSSTDGLANTNAMHPEMGVWGENRYPAFWITENYDVGIYESNGENEATRLWYLPAINELKAIFQNLEVVNAAFNASGKTSPFGNGNSFWSSTAVSSPTCAEAYNGTSQVTAEKTSLKYVCAIRVF